MAELVQKLVSRLSRKEYEFPIDPYEQILWAMETNSCRGLTKDPLDSRLFYMELDRVNPRRFKKESHYLKSLYK